MIYLNRVAQIAKIALTSRMRLISLNINILTIQNADLKIRREPTSPILAVCFEGLLKANLEKDRFQSGVFYQTSVTFFR